MLRKSSFLVLALQTSWNVREASPATPPVPHVGLRTELAFPFFPAIDRNGICQNLFSPVLSRCPKPSPPILNLKIRPRMQQNPTRNETRMSRWNRDGTLTTQTPTHLTLCLFSLAALPRQPSSSNPDHSRNLEMHPPWMTGGDRPGGVSHTLGLQEIWMIALVRRKRSRSVGRWRSRKHL